MRDPFAPVVVVSVTDPAIAFKTPAERAQYEDKRDVLPAFKDGAKPVLFTITPCSSTFAIAVLDPSSQGVRELLAFRRCVHHVEMPNGEVLTPKATYAASYGGEMAEEEWVTVVAKAVGVRRLQEIANVAYRFSMLDDIDPLLQQPGPPLQS
jgi:hypothetical protein